MMTVIEKKAYKKYCKEKKKLKKELIKSAKEFEPYGHNQMMKVFFKLLKIMALKYTNKDNVSFETEGIYQGRWNNFCVEPLTKIVELIEKLDDVVCDSKEEYEIMNQIFKLVKNNMYYWWD